MDFPEDCLPTSDSWSVIPDQRAITGTSQVAPATDEPWKNVLVAVRPKCPAVCRSGRIIRITLEIRMFHGTFRRGATGSSSFPPFGTAGGFRFRPQFLVHFALTLGVGISVLRDGCHPLSSTVAEEFPLPSDTARRLQTVSLNDRPTE